jgi:transposase-like protein
MTISFARHQFPPAIIRHAVWLYVRFTLSYRDVEDLLAERGLDVSYETVRSPWHCLRSQARWSDRATDQRTTSGLADSILRAKGRRHDRTHDQRNAEKSP